MFEMSNGDYIWSFFFIVSFFLLNHFRHCMEYNILGIDCEWNKAKKLALLQLATHRGLCVLIRLSRMKKLPNELKVCHFLGSTVYSDF